MFKMSMKLSGNDGMTEKVPPLVEAQSAPAIMTESADGRHGRRDSQKVDSRMTLETEEDPVKRYLNSLYQTARESTWRSFIVDRSQGIVFTTTLSSVNSFLWLVALFGMLEWSISSDKIVGLTTFCASFSYSSVVQCHVLPGQSLSCPYNFQTPTCIGWYDISSPADTTLIITMQVLGVVGTLISFVSTVLAFYTLMKLVDQIHFRRAIQALTAIMTVESLVSLGFFVVVLVNPYFTEIVEGKNCVLLPSDTGGLTCVPASDIVPLLSQGYATTAAIVIFVFSVLAIIFSAMGAMKVHYDLDKED